MPAHKTYTPEELRFLRMLSRQYPTLRAAGAEIINLKAILNLPKGCAFCPRCDAAMKICLEAVPEEIDINENHRAACWMNIKEAAMAGKEA